MGVRTNDHQLVGGKQYFDSDIQFAGQWYGNKKEVIALTNVATTARTLAADESGALVTLNPSTNDTTTISVTLPTPEAGMNFIFAYTADAGNAAADVSITTADDDVDFIGAVTTGEASNANRTVIGHSKITFDAGQTKGTDLGGTVLSIVSDGSDWYIKSFVTPPDVTSAHVGTATKAITLSAAA